MEELVFSSEQTLTMEGYEQVVTRLLYGFRYRTGILERFLRDPQVHEIMVNGPDHIFLEYDEGTVESDLHFLDQEELTEIIQNIAAGVRREINELHPILDARLPDGSRVHAVYDNIAADGPVLTIRKFAKNWISMEELIAKGTITAECAAFLERLIHCGANLFLSGGTSSGKTTFLNALSDYIPEEERVVIIEDSRELAPRSQRNLVQLECRNSNMAGQGEIRMEQLIRASLRMRPDRIIVGEVRGREAQDMLQAMNTGHDAMSTGHANSVRGMLLRLEAMCLMAGGMPLGAIRSQIVEGIDVMIHLRRMPDGSRKVTEVQELLGVRGDTYGLNPLYIRRNGEELLPTGNRLQRPKFEGSGI